MKEQERGQRSFEREEEAEKFWGFEYFGKGEPEWSAMLVVKGKYSSVMRTVGNWEMVGGKGMNWEGGQHQRNLFSPLLYNIIIGLTIIITQQSLGF